MDHLIAVGTAVHVWRFYKTRLAYFIHGRTRANKPILQQGGQSTRIVAIPLTCSCTLDRSVPSRLQAGGAARSSGKRTGRRRNMPPKVPERTVLTQVRYRKQLFIFLRPGGAFSMRNRVYATSLVLAVLMGIA